MITVDSLHYTYPGADKPTLQDIRLHIAEGQAVLVRGTSGSGKTTLLYCLNGLIPHIFPGVSGGSIRVNGLTPGKASLPEMARRVGTVFQNPESQIFMMRVEDDVAFGCENLCLPKEDIVRRRDEALRFMGLEDMRHRETFKLSGGYKQRLAVSSIYAMQPGVFLFDEPTTDMDADSRKDFFSILQALKENGKTVVLVEHRYDDYLPLMDKVFSLENGRMKENAVFRKVAVPVRTGKMPSASSVVDLKQITFGYDPALPVIESLDIEIGKGDIVALCGSNGCGKTTLLKVVGGLLQPQKGVASLLKMRQPKLEALVGRVGFLFQNPDEQLFGATVEDEIAFGANCLGRTIDVERYLEIAGLGALAKRHPQTISRGQRQILAVVSIMAIEPELIILDEPTTGLDDGTWQKLMSLLHDFADRGGTVVFSTHNEEAAAWARRKLTLDKGRIIRDEISG